MRWRFQIADISERKMNNINEILSKVERGMSLREQRDLILRSIKPKYNENTVETSAVSDEPLEEHIRALTVLDDLIIKELEEEVYRLNAALDIDVEEFTEEVVSGILDHYTAQEFINNCTEGWFRQLLITDRAKVELANRLIKKCHTYVGKSVPTLWVSLAINHQETVNKCRFTVDELVRP